VADERRAYDLTQAVSLASRASHFCYGKSGQNHAPGTTVSATSCCLNFPALLAPSGPARTTRHIPVARPSLTLRTAFGVQIGSPADLVGTSLCSNMRALLPLGAAMQLATSLWLALRFRSGPPTAFKSAIPADLVDVVQGRGKSSASLQAIRGLRTCITAQCRPWMAGGGARVAPLAVPQPRCRSRGKGAHVRRQGCRSSRRRAIGKRQGEMRQQDVAESTAAGAMVFGYFLPKQKVSRSPPRRAEPDANAATQAHSALTW
jgi:hypothetical protein